MAKNKPVLRMAFYSHDTMGLGHVRRNMLLSSAVLQAIPDAEILLINGVRESGNFFLPKGIDAVTLPTYLKTPEGKYQPRSLGVDVKRLVSIRSSIIYGALDSFAPDIVIIDNVPRGAMSELDATLPMLAQKNTHLVLGLRDIIDEPAQVERQWIKLDNVDVIRKYFSSIWVYGDASFYDLTQAYAFDRDLRDKTSFVGYLDATLRPRKIREPGAIIPGLDKPYVLCLVGGGQDGFELASCFSKARFPEGHVGVMIAGSMMPGEQYEKLLEAAAGRDDLLVIRFVAEPLELLRQAHAVVAMGGYNTTTEILSFHKRALIVPRVRPRLEQWIRASMLAECGLISCIAPDELTVAGLSRWLAQEGEPPDPRDTLDFNGLSMFVENITRIYQARTLHQKNEIQNSEYVS